MSTTRSGYRTDAVRVQARGLEDGEEFGTDCGGPWSWWMAVQRCETCGRVGVAHDSPGEDECGNLLHDEAPSTPHGEPCAERVYTDGVSARTAWPVPGEPHTEEDMARLVARYDLAVVVWSDGTAGLAYTGADPEGQGPAELALGYRALGYLPPAALALRGRWSLYMVDLLHEARLLVLQDAEAALDEVRGYTAPTLHHCAACRCSVACAGPQSAAACPGVGLNDRPHVGTCGHILGAHPAEVALWR